VSDASNPTVIVLNESAASSDALFVIAQGNLSGNSVIFSLNSSNTVAFILLSGNGSVIFQEVIVNVCV
jgi:hypothetical protein